MNVIDRARWFFLYTRTGAAIALIVGGVLLFKGAEIAGRLGLVKHCRPEWGNMAPGCSREPLGPEDYELQSELREP